MTALVQPASGAQQGWEAALLGHGIDLDLVRSDLRGDRLGAAVLVAGDAGTATADASGENAFTACEIETLVAEGPGTAALETGVAVWVRDITAETRWRPWRRPVLELWRAALAVPLSADGTPGALVLYARDPEALEALHSRLTGPASAGDGARERL